MDELPGDLIVLRYGELFLKGENRPHFESVLEANVRRALADLPLPHPERGQGRLFVTCPPEHSRAALSRLQRVFGLSSLSPALATPPELEALGQAALALALPAIARHQPRSFRVQARRSDKRFPVPSPELGRILGGQIHEATGLAVNLTEPDLVVGVEVGPRRSFVFVERLPGAGGLPVGVSGRVALLLSGGIDSPVAGHLMQKRGCTLQPIYFHSPPYTGSRTQAKVEGLAARLAPPQGEIALATVPFTAVQLAIRDGAPAEMAVVLYRRAMMRIATALARRHGCLALATGENLGQVASQTLSNLGCIELAAELPVLRPLLAFDKIEIIALAQRLGTYDLSTAPYEDCCALFVPKHPLTRARPHIVAAAEERLGLQPLLDRAVEETELHQLPA